MSIKKIVCKALNYRINLNNSGFTLAEVLITLGIIGIIAEITIPSLMFDMQKQNWVVTLQKSYTTFNQALIKVANDNSCPGDLRCTGLFDGSVTMQDFGDAVSSYFKVAKNCGLNSNQGCFSNSVGPNYDGTGTRNTTYDTATSNSYRFITADGVSVLITSNSDNCGSVTGFNYLTQMCGQVFFDVNGLKGPNNFGRDIFRFYISNGKGPLIYPLGGKDVNVSGTSGWWKNGDNCNLNNPLGTRCAGRIMEESWQMKY